MLKLLKTINAIRDEVRYALKELRETVAALEALLLDPKLDKFDAFRKEALELIASIKEKGK